VRGKVGIAVDADEKGPFLAVVGSEVHDGEISFPGLYFGRHSPSGIV
jgi:hypothetical protein